MKLIFVTQQVDPADPVLGATVAKLHALAASVDELVVLSLAAVPGVLPANSRVVNFGAGSRLGRGLRFARALARELPRRRRSARAHVPDLRRARRARSRGRCACPCSSGSRTGTAARLLRLAAVVSTNGGQRRPPLVPDRDREGRRRSDTGSTTRRFRAASAPAPAQLRAVVLGRTSPAKGIDDDSARGRTRAGRAAGRLRHLEQPGGGAPSRRAGAADRASSGSSTGRRSASRFRATRSATSTPAPTCS